MRYFLCILAFLMIAPAFAQDQGLYDPVPPPGSAFVRFINTAPETRGVFANGKKFADAPAFSITPYYVMKEGATKLMSGSVDVDHTVKAGKFYTVLTGEYPKVVEDKPADDPSKAQLIFYNLFGTESLSVKTADGKTDIIKSVSRGNSGERTMNAVKVKMAVFKGDEKIMDVGEVTLQRKASYALIMMDGISKLMWTRATTDTEK